jgi:HK97 family phage prohead protease
MPPTAATDVTTRNIPPLSLRATVRPGSVDPEKRTAEVVWTTGARVMRGFWERYYEELSLDPKHVRLERLNNGAPLLNAHDGWDARGVLGVVEAGSAKLAGKEGVAIVRFARAEDDPEADKVFRKVLDGILQNVSVGYRVHKMEKVEGGDEQIPVYRCVDWEPYEISVVPMGADDGAGFRSTETRSLNPCVLVTQRSEKTMPPETPPAAPPAVTPPPAAPAPDVTEDATRAAADAAVAAERERIAGIQGLVARHKLGDELGQKLVKDGTSLEKARGVILDALAARTDEQPPHANAHISGGADLRRESARAGITNALLHRVDPTRFKLEDAGRPYAHRRLLDLGSDCVEIFAGTKVRGLTPMEAAGLSLGMQVRAGYSTTSDFPLILADVANKSLRAAYTEAPATYTAIGRRVPLPDFKPVRRTQLGEAPQLKKVNEHGEFTTGSVGEGKEQYGLATYGRIFSVSRQAIVNDDMDAFSRMPALFGRSARDLESDLVWEQITANGNMGDGVALFHATHGNLAAAGAAIAVSTIGSGRAAMRAQKGVDKKQFINVTPKYLVVPVILETIADQFVSANLLANASGSVNPFSGKLQVVAEPRLDANSLTAWYLFGDPSQIDIVEYGFLEGQEGPVIESRVGFEVDGLEIKCRHDFAAKVIDHRGIYKNPGA